MKYNWSGDDLGSLQYTFIDCSIAEAVNETNQLKPHGYNIVEVKFKRKFWLVGTRIIDILLEDPIKIKALEGTQHYSKPTKPKPTSEGWCLLFHKKYHTFTGQYTTGIFCEKCREHRIP